MKNLLASLASRLVGDRSHPLASEDEAAALVGQRERIAQRPISKPELALVVDAPDVVRRIRLAQRRRPRRHAWTRHSRLHETSTYEDVADGARRRQHTLQARLQ